jgi:lipopolysaccharide export LptBFGC system permease protein LptF
VLNNGKVFNIDQEKIKQIDYSKLKMSYQPKVAKIRSDTIWEYWEVAKIDKTRAKDLSINIMISFFPLGTFLFALAFSITNVRHEKPQIYPMMFIVILVYYLMMYKVSLTYPWGAIGVIVVTHIASYIYFRRKILRRY